MAWTNSPFTVWHGTVGPYADSIIRNRPDLSRCSDEADFGRGFYVTRIREHAVLHANQKYDDLRNQYDRARRTFKNPFNPECAALIEFTIELGDLSRLLTLAFVQATQEWLDFVTHCRQPSYNHRLVRDSYYDVVYGPLLEVGTDRPIPGREQISFHSPRGIGLLIPVRGHSPITRGGPYLS